MKASAIPALVLLAALSILAPAGLCAAPAAYGVSIDKVARGDDAEITRGTSLMTVLRLMGPAQRKLSPDVWVYENHPIRSDSPSALGCNLLVITFVEGKAADLKIVNDRAIAVIAANLKLQAAASQVAKK